MFIMYIKSLKHHDLCPGGRHARPAQTGYIRAIGPCADGRRRKGAIAAGTFFSPMPGIKALRRGSNPVYRRLICAVTPDPPNGLLHSDTLSELTYGDTRPESKVVNYVHHQTLRGAGSPP